MQCLRCFSSPLRGRELLLADSVAETLCRVLLTTPLEQRVTLLTAALRDGPPLAVWAGDQCLGNQVSLGNEPSIEALARGVAENLAAALHDSLSPFSVSGRDEVEDAAALERANREAAVAVEVARRAAIRLAGGWPDRDQRVPPQGDTSEAQSRPAAASPSSAADVAYLLGLLHNRDAYLFPSLVAADADDVGPEQLLSHVRPLLGPLTPTVGRLAADAVVAARAEWNGSRLEPMRTGAASLGEGAAAERLTTLVAKLCRLARLEDEFEIALEEAKLQAMYKLAAGAGHEINNPLGSIAGRAQLLLRDESEPERRRTLAKINSQAFRAHEMIADMMLFARPPQPQYEEIAPQYLVEGLVDEMQEMTQQQEAEIVSHIADDVVSFRADASQLRVVLRAMCTNALEATGLGGRIEITVGRGPTDKVLSASASPAATVQITVRDNGPGFSEEERQHLFDPFYSGREAGRGLGFGLSKCWRIIRNHGGRIDVTSDPGHGATFEIILPTV